MPVPAISMKYEKKSWSKCWCVLCCILNDFLGLLSRERFWHHFLTVVDPGPWCHSLFLFFCLLCIDKENRNKKVASPHCTVGIQYTHLHWNATSWLPRLSSTFFHSVKSLCDCTFYIWSCIYFDSNSKVNVDKFHPQSIYYGSKLLALDLLHWLKLFFGAATHLVPNPFDPWTSGPALPVPLDKWSP